MRIKTKLIHNLIGRDFLCGDLHGHGGVLGRALEYLEFNSRYDRLICTGDLGDRGPDSAKTMLLFSRLNSLYSTLGNHDYGARHYLATSLGFTEETTGEEFQLSRSMLTRHGGGWLVEAPQLHLRQPDTAHAIYALLRDLPLIIQVGEGVNRYHVVHAYPHDSEDSHITDKQIDEMPDEVSAKTCPDRFSGLLWARPPKHCSEFHPNGEDALSPTYFGHQPFNLPNKILGVTGIDTGCGKGGSLTIVENPLDPKFHTFPT